MLGAPWLTHTVRMHVLGIYVHTNDVCQRSSYYNSYQLSPWNQSFSSTNEKKIGYLRNPIKMKLLVRWLDLIHTINTFVQLYGI